MLVEHLETRQLLSVSLKSHVLNIGGTRGDDSIVLTRVAAGGSSEGDSAMVSVNGESYSFPSRLVQRISIRGGAGNDTISLQGMASTDEGLSSSAILSALAAVPAVIRGGSGNDTIAGGLGNDSVYGDAGDDSIDGDGGADRLHGGSGADIIQGRGGDDLLYGDSGSDELYGNDGIDRLYGGSGSDSLSGGNSLDYYYGGSGPDAASYYLGAAPEGGMPYRAMRSVENQVGASAPEGADSYEPDDEVMGAKAIATDGTAQMHSLHSGSDVDWASFFLPTASAVTIWTEGESGDTCLWLYSASDLGNPISYDDDSGEGAFSQIAYSADAPLAAGSYYVRVAAYASADPVSSYALRVTASSAGDPGSTVLPDGYEPDNSAAAATVIVADGTWQTHSLHTAGDYDWIRFDLSTRSWVAISVEGDSGRTSMWMYRASDVTSGIGYFHSTDGILLDAGSYYLRVELFSGFGDHDPVETYSIGLLATPGEYPGSEVTPDSYEVDDSAGQASTIAADGSPQAHTLGAGDQDWVQFTLPGRSDLAIRTGDTGGAARLWLYNSDGSTLIAASADASPDRIDLGGVQGLTAGTYLLKVAGASATVTGQYTLSVTALAASGGPLVQTDAFAAPGGAQQMSFSAEYGLLFLRNSGSAIRVVDTATHQQINVHMALEQFTDMDLTPDGKYLYVADFGGEAIGYGYPVRPSWVHRFDLATRSWDEPEQVSGIAYRIEAVDDAHFVLLEADQWVSASLLRWEENQPMATWLASASADYYGDIEYDPATGRLFHGGSGSSSSEIHVLRVVGETLSYAESTGTYGSAQGGGGSSVLSTDGQRFYYGRLQVESLDVAHNLHSFPEVIVAATADYAFGTDAYYDANTGQRAGDLQLDNGVYAVDAGGQELFVFSPDDNMLRRFAAPQ